MAFSTGIAVLKTIPASILEECRIGTDADEFDQFMAVYNILSRDLVNDMQNMGVSADALEWFKKNMDHNVPGGKMNRGRSVFHAYRSLVAPRQPTGEETFRCFVLGWAVEWLQAFFLVADDLMDASITRRGQPCWYKMPGVGNIAINDSIMLEANIYQMLKRYFGGETYYLALVELFLQTTWQTEVGQLHDLITAPEDSIDLTRFTLEKYKLIVKYKTAYYSFYLPVAEAMIMAGITEPALFKSAEKILLVMGEYFQIQDDYLDCYGAPEVIGKIGTDIQDNKCSWLVCQALLRATPEQRKVLVDNYARKNADNEAKVKELYRQMDLEKVFKDYEEATYAELLDLIKKEAGSIPEAVFMDFAKKIFKRQK
eukprot:comp17976_c0_seq1/m.18357 comp17976_c0_seq1/g.18357  ORF comp17976_c0_seq1/g.18357 comp17976_c0_seq1/m.18357 type:complete len:370 (-) comp17976_c0_seq1:527-1636(-)